MSQTQDTDSSPSRVMDEVRDFYNRYPYPQPVLNLENYRSQWQDAQRRRADFHLFWPSRPYKEEQTILVAGCGTSQAARHALRWPDAQVTGIDISGTSLRHTRELKRKYNLRNLTIRKIAIEQVEQLGSQFDKIICTGVLHHLDDPEAGLKALRSVLKQDGAMHLMVYAAYGRTGIYMMQDYAHRLGITPSNQEIEDLKMVLSELPRGHPLDYLLRQAPDFQHPGALADALLNPQDRAYTVPQLFKLLQSCGMRFVRWFRQAPYLPQCGILSRTPHAARLANLPLQEQFAAVELFRGTITQHSFIAYRDDHPQGTASVHFDGDDWQGYVPIRQPRLVCIEDRLPPETAAVLINQDHIDTDLIHPIDQLGKRLFTNIDDYKSVRSIIQSVEPFPTQNQIMERGRTFFERLWLYDHVVFDASKGIH